jgi:hypothetical protein
VKCGTLSSAEFFDPTPKLTDWCFPIQFFEHSQSWLVADRVAVLAFTVLAVSLLGISPKVQATFRDG